MNRMLFVAVLAVTFLSCSKKTTEVLGTWKGEDFQPVDETKMLIVAAFPSRLVRKTFEVDLRDRLNRRKNIQAMASLEALPAEKEISRETFEQYFNEKDIDLVLVTRVVDAKDMPQYDPGDRHALLDPNYNDFFSYYRRLIVKVPEPGHFDNVMQVQLETNAYNADTGEIVWRCVTESFDEGDTEKVIDELSKLIVKNMEKDRVIL